MRVNLEKLQRFNFTRREFIKSAAATTGAFVLAAYVPFLKGVAAPEAGPAQGIYDPNVFLKIDSDNTVTIISKHLEMGQGAATGLATLVAEELGADWSTVRFEVAPANPPLYNNLLFG